MRTKFYCIVMYNYRIVMSTYVISFAWRNNAHRFGYSSSSEHFEFALSYQYYNEIQHRLISPPEIIVFKANVSLERHFPPGENF